MTEKIADITINPRTGEVITVSFSETSLKFKCQRCAVFCCKCGGPRLLPKDVADLKQSGKSQVPSTIAHESTLQNKEDGSCIFLTADLEGVFACKVYDSRPTLCRVYPFQFERIGENSFSMNLIPCCNGLNTPDGQPVDESFFTKHLKKAFLDLFAHDQR